MHVLVAGFGWLGSAIADALAERGHRVTGVRRSVRDRCRHAVVRADLADAAAADSLPDDLDAIVACQAAGERSPEAYRRAYVDVNRTLLSHAARCGCRSFVYTGSTGVFGQDGGEEIVEDTPVSPSGATAEILVEAEALVLGAAARLVRLSGLYGPGRTGVLDRVRSGRLALGPGEDTWMNWCHLDDAVAVVLLTLERGEPGGIYHGTDGTPVRRREVVTWIAERLGIDPPLGATASRRGANRRVLGPRTRDRLGFAPRWPSFRDGLDPLVPKKPGNR